MEPGLLHVTLAFAGPGVERIVEVSLPTGTTVAQAVAHCGFPGNSDDDRSPFEFAIFGQRASPDTPLHDGDRVELTRALRLDPKVARQTRALAKPLAKVPPRRKRRAGIMR